MSTSPAQRLPFGPRTLAVVRPYLWTAPLIVVMGLVSAALEGVSIGLIMPLLNIMVGHDQSGTMSGLPSALSRIGAGYDAGTRVLIITGGILALLVGKNLVSFANGVLGAWVYGKAGYGLRNGLTARLTTAAYTFFLKQSPGRLLNAISTESWRATDAIAIALSMMVSASAVIILLAFLFALSWKLTLAVMVGLALIQLVQVAISRRLRLVSREVTKRNGELAGRMLHLVDGSRLIRLFGRGAAERARFNGVSDSVRRLTLRLDIGRSAIAPATEVSHGLLFITVIVASWRAGVEFSVIAAFVVLLYRMQPHVRTLQASATQLQSLTGSLNEVEWLLEDHADPTPPSPGRPAWPPKEGIRFAEVSFRFAGEAMPAVLDRAYFDLRAHRATALVGRSGAGKTTVVNLLCRFLDPDAGAVLVDGTPLAEIDAEDWRRHLALASGDLELCEGTVFENIAYGVDSASLDEVVRAAEIADADRFIRALPQGYETVTGYRGVNLSAGQRQRIGLARALLRDPDVLILDEATNAIDGISELSIIETLKARAGRRTTIVISHHRSTLAFCDDVVILREGRATAQMELADVAGADMEALYSYVPTSSGS